MTSAPVGAFVMTAIGAPAVPGTPPLPGSMLIADSQSLATLGFAVVSAVGTVTQGLAVPLAARGITAAVQPAMLFSGQLTLGVGCVVTAY